MIEDLTENKAVSLDKGICPDCRGVRFLEGPHGGVCVNIKCANCGAKFNVVPGLPGTFGKQRIGWPEKRKILPMLRVIKSKHGIEPSELLVATVTNGTEDMELLIVSNIDLGLEPMKMAIEISALLVTMYHKKEGL
jgi:hypothetical protein